MPEKFLIKFDPVTGDRLSTIPVDLEVSQEKQEELIDEGYEFVSCEDWNKLLGNIDGKIYIKDVVNGGYIVKPPYVPTLEESQEEKIKELKVIRNEKELEPVEYNDTLFDADKDSLDRLNYAIITLETSGQESIQWTTADNTDATVTAADLRGVIAAVGVRSNLLHIKYRELKARVMQAQSNTEVEAVAW